MLFEKINCFASFPVVHILFHSQINEESFKNTSVKMGEKGTSADNATTL